MKAATGRAQWRRRGSLLVAVAAVSTMGAGCLSNSEQSPALLAADAASGESWVEAWDGTDGPRVPDLVTFVSALDLDTEQAAVFETALAELRANVAERRQDIAGRGRVGGNRPGGYGMPGGVGEFEPPLLGFLGTVVPVLEVEQVEGLVALLPARGPREGERAGNGRGPREGDGPRAGRGRGGPGGFLADALNDLDLSADQRTALRELGQESRETFHALRMAFRDGTISAEELRDQAKAAREEAEATLSGILDEAQFASLQESLAEHRAETAQRRIDSLAADIARRAEFLTKVLSLSDSQAAEVTALLDATVAERTAVLTGLRDGTIEIEDALYEGYLISTRTADGIRALLDDDQKAVFDALRGFLPGQRGPGRR